MSFIIGNITTVTKKINFSLPASEGSAAVKCDLLVTFKLRTTSEIRERHQKMQAYITEMTRYIALVERNPDEILEMPTGGFDDAYLLEDITNILGVKNSDGEDIEFTTDLLAQVLETKEAKTAFVMKWNEINLTDPGSKRKN